jgi:diacylglycerol kinase family enzyme
MLADGHEVRPKTTAVTSLYVFANPSSGGGRAKLVIDNLPRFFRFPAPALGAIDVHVYDLKNEAVRSKGFLALEEARDLGLSVRIIVAGGDGTVKWLIAELFRLRCLDFPLGVLPFGTGNDLSRVSGWGKAAPRDLSRANLERWLVSYSLADPVEMDVWESRITVDATWGRFDVARDGQVLPLPDAQKRFDSMVVLNYFSIGLDARAVFNFETHRRRGAVANTVQFAVEGGLLSLPGRGEALNPRSIKVDGTPVAFARGMQGLVFQNISSYAAGSDFWGPPARLDPFVPQHPGDGQLEVLQVGKVLDIGISKASFGTLGGLRRFAQGREFALEFDASREKVLYFHADGEPGRAVAPESVSVKHAFTVFVLQRNDAKLSLISSVGRENILISGVLLKSGRGGHFSQRWQPRFVALCRRRDQSVTLEWFRGDVHRGSLFVGKDVLVSKSTADLPRPGSVFVVSTSRRTVRLCAKDEAEALEWIRRLEVKGGLEARM